MGHGSCTSGVFVKDEYFAETKCPCGAAIKAKIAKPNFMTPTISKFNCQWCESKFLIRCRVTSTKGPRTYAHDFEILHLSKKAEDKCANPIRQVVSKVIEQVGKRPDGPEFD